MDALTKINARGFAFAHPDNDPDAVARGGANELLGVLSTESLALLHQMSA